MFELEKPLQKSNFRRKLGKEFYILKRKFDNLISKENFSKQYSENFEINHSVFKHNSMILRPLKDVETQNLACLSLGCPMLSPNFFKVAEKYIDASKKPIILYAFY